MSKSSRRRRRIARRAARIARHYKKNRCTVCRAKGDRVDRCDAGVCRRCHWAVTGSPAFPECKNFADRCSVRPRKAKEPVYWFGGGS